MLVEIRSKAKQQYGWGAVNGLIILNLVFVLGLLLYTMYAKERAADTIRDM